MHLGLEALGEGPAPVSFNAHFRINRRAEPTSYWPIVLWPIRSCSTLGQTFQQNMQESHQERHHEQQGWPRNPEDDIASVRPVFHSISYREHGLEFLPTLQPWPSPPTVEYTCLHP